MKGDPFFSIGRRSFLQTAASCLGLSICGLDLSSGSLFAPQNSARFDSIRANLLQLVNEERAVEKLDGLAVDDLATPEGKFANHWGRDGLKPYQRYSFAGGIDATEENISAADNTWSSQLKDLTQDTAYLHVRLYGEKPPNDGHRKAILGYQHTHVGFGVGLDDLRLRVVEIYVAKYVELPPMRRNAKPGDRFILAGKLLNSSHILYQVEVCYEPLPKVPDLSWLLVPRPYSLPDDSVVLLPILPKGVTYANKTRGVLEVGPDGSFSVPVTLFRETPGIYTE